MVEIAWKNDGIDREEIVIAAPERNGLGTDETDGTLRIAIVERTREGDDSGAGHDPAAPELLAPATVIQTTSSMTEFGRSSTTSADTRVARTLET